MSTSNIPGLPADLRVDFLAEGAANIVYRVKLPAPGARSLDIQHAEADLDSLVAHGNTPPASSVSPPDSPLHDNPHGFLRDKLLRLRKDVTWIAPYETLFATQSRLINPLFDARDIVASSLVTLPDGLITALNSALAQAESTGARGAKRHGMLLATDEPHGLLVTDMSPRDPSEILIEIKPKWLAQSPSAPSGARRCRTCALQAMRTQADNPAASEHRKSGFCPLDLVSGDTRAVYDAAVAMVTASKATRHLGTSEINMLVAKTQHFFLETSLLSRLQNLQQRCDPQGVLQLLEPVPESFLVATTLRDCTLFLRLTPRHDGAVDGRLGDLDLKTPEQSKIDYWRGIETRLRDDGWYAGRGSTVGCRLERQHSP